MQRMSDNLSFAAQAWAGSPVAATGEANAAATASRQVQEKVRQLEDKLRRSEAAINLTSALVDLLGKLTAAHDVPEACLTLASELQQFVGCPRVAVGLCRRPGQRIRLAAISRMAQFDPRSETVRALESTLDECMLRTSMTMWPADSESERHATLAHQRLCGLTGEPSVVSVPLRNDTGTIVGVLVLLGVDLSGKDHCLPFLRLCESAIGSCLELHLRVGAGAIVRYWRQLMRHRKSWQAKVALATAAAIAGVLVLPVRYKIKCDCLVQPETRRFVVAPFEGVLEEALVKQGEVASQGQILARLDGREIRWELAGLAAERSRAAKQRDTAMATGKIAEAQAARLEMERLDLKIQLLEHRAQNLEVKSPVDGIVISGDLERANGAPLTIGQTLFEVAPTSTMVAELAVPEDEISYVREAMNVSVRFDAYPGQTWTGAIERIHPRSEIRDDQNVFIAEFTLNNPDAQFRPGMNGRAKIVSDRRCMAWNLFHKVIEWVMRTLGW